MLKPVLILGGGGHAAVLVDILRQQGRTISAIVCPDLSEDRKIFLDIIHFQCDEEVLSYDCNEVELVNGIGSLPGNNLREQIYNKFSRLGYHFATVVSPQAVLGSHVNLGEGVQVMSNAVVQTGVIVGSNSIINTSAIVEHDCRLGLHNHIASGAVVCGDVELANNVHIGAGATVIQGCFIGKETVVGAGACVTSNLVNFSTVYPAKIYIKIMRRKNDL